MGEERTNVVASAGTDKSEGSSNREGDNSARRKRRKSAKARMIPD